MAALYELVDDFRRLYELAADPDVDSDMIAGSLECLEADLEAKAGDYVHVIKNLEASSSVLKGRIDFLNAELKVAKLQKDAIDNNTARIKDRMKEALVATGHGSGLQAGTYKIKVMNNGGVLPLEVVGDVPDTYMKVVYQVDNEKIRRALDSGVELSFAHYLPRGTRLDIK